jgi:hypothetical protein
VLAIANTAFLFPERTCARLDWVSLRLRGKKRSDPRRTFIE